MKTKKPTKLKPCPFCGGKDEVDRWFGPILVQTVGFFSVECINKTCGVCGPSRKSKAAAITAWNRRKP